MRIAAIGTGGIGGPLWCLACQGRDECELRGPGSPARWSNPATATASQRRCMIHPSGAKPYSKTELPSRAKCGPSFSCTAQATVCKPWKADVVAMLWNCRV